jgi:hypothetical protein
MSGDLRVLDSSPEDLAEGVAGVPPEQVITVIFRHPVTGEDVPVKISVFQCQQGAGFFGVGVYMTGQGGDLAHGTVLRWAQWNGAQRPDPAVTYWEAGPTGGSRPGRGKGRRYSGTAA